MYPILFESGSLVIPAWHVFFALGAVAGYFLLIHLARHHFPQLRESDLGWLFAFCYIGGYFGARILSVIIDQPDIEGFNKVIAVFQLGPMTFYGGLLGALFAGLCFAHYRQLSIPDLADMAFICGMLGLTLGRIGCFLNGDDYGIPVALDTGAAVPWWAVQFANHQNPIPRYPVQLMEALSAFVILGLGIRYFAALRERFFPGIVALAVVAIYALSRYFLEFFRGDPRGWVIEGVLSPSQMISIVMLVVVNIMFLIRLRRSETDNSR